MAKTHNVGPKQQLQAVIDGAEAGDVIKLQAGQYHGNFVIDKSLTLSSAIKQNIDNSNPVIIDANGTGNAITLLASHIVIDGLRIVNWGDDLSAQNAGIYSDKKASHLAIKNNYLEGRGFGMWLQKADNLKVLNNRIKGDASLRSADRGNGIQLSIVKNVEVSGNEISHTRDGLYVISSQHNVLKNNTMHDLRYGIHYMYSHSNQVMGNLAYNTRAGYALMSSKYLTVSGNETRDSEDYGFLMNFITYSKITNNRIQNVWTKPENKVLGRDGKGLFVYNSGYNTIAYNTVDTAEIGIHLTAGSEKTKVYGNCFINNPTQVKYVVNREEEWSFEGEGNFWSNYLGWDLNNDGRGDVAFEPNDSIEKIVWKYPEARVLLDSPAVVILRWMQGQFPILKPVGVKDSFPLMKSFLSNKEPQKKERVNNKQPNKTLAQHELGSNYE